MKHMLRPVIALLLLLLPQSKAFFLDTPYAIKPGDLLLLVVIVVFLRVPVTSRIVTNNDRRLSRAMALASLASVVSGIWGLYYLNSQGLASLSTVNGTVNYGSVLIQRWALLAICFGGFHLVVRLKEVSNHDLVKFWYYGLTVAVALHILSYLTVSDYLANRGGVFLEGNHGGNFYLLSIFLMWAGVKNGWKFGKRGIVASVIGILLSQSTAALSILMVLGAIGLMTSSTGRGFSAKKFWPMLLGVLVAFAIVFNYGDEMLQKLTSDEVNSTTFSRMDRISSIMAGLSMFAENPLMGVGIQGYAFLLPSHADDLMFSMGLTDARRIANNIYVELLSEQGLIGLTVFAYFVYSICAPAFSSPRKNVLQCLAFLAVLSSWMAFPTYAVTFDWIGFALLYRLSTQPQAIRETQRVSISRTRRVVGP